MNAKLPIIAAFVALMMLTVPFSISNDSYAEDPISESGLYFETNAPLTSSANIEKLFTDYDVEHIISDYVLDPLGIIDTYDVTSDLMKELSVNAGRTSKVLDNSIVSMYSKAYSGKLVGSYVSEHYSGDMGIAGDDILDLYKYLGSDSVLSSGTITLDLVFDVITMYKSDCRFVKLSDDTYTYTACYDTDYSLLTVKGSIGYVSTDDPTFVKQLGIDMNSCISYTEKITYEFEDPIADVDVGSTMWVGRGYDSCEVEYDYRVSFGDKTISLFDSSVYLVSLMDSIPTEYSFETYDVFDGFSSPYEFIEEYYLYDILDSEADDLEIACAELGTVSEGYSAASAKIGSIPSVGGDDDGDDDSGSKVVPIVIGVVAGVLVIAAVAFFLIKRRA